MTPEQRTTARRILSTAGQHPGLSPVPQQQQVLEVWRYPPSGLWARWMLYRVDAAYWVRRVVCQPASAGSISTSSAEIHVPSPTVWPLISNVSGMTLPMIPLEDDQLPRDASGEDGLVCGGLRLAWAPGAVADGPWTHMVVLHGRLITCFEDALPPVAQRSPSR